jgi:hypothetical protein
VAGHGRVRVVASDSNQLAAYLNSLPAIDPPAFTEQQALTVVALPLSCFDHPQALPGQRTDYLWVHDSKPHILELYDTSRVFYRSYDWHSAVNSIWTMVVVAKQFPNSPLMRTVPTACWTILSSSAAIPNGRCLPSAFGIQTLREGCA